MTRSLLRPSLPPTAEMSEARSVRGSGTRITTGDGVSFRASERRASAVLTSRSPVAGASDRIFAASALTASALAASSRSSTVDRSVSRSTMFTRSRGRSRAPGVEPVAKSCATRWARSSRKCTLVESACRLMAARPVSCARSRASTWKWNRRQLSPSSGRRGEGKLRTSDAAERTVL